MLHVVNFLWVWSNMWYIRHSLWASKEVFVDSRKPKIGKFICLVLFVFCQLYDCLHLNDYDHQFQELFIQFSLKTTHNHWHSPGHKHIMVFKGVGKHIFYCFNDECCPKWEFKNQPLSQSCRASPWYMDLIANQAILFYFQEVKESYNDCNPGSGTWSYNCCV